MTAFQDIKNGVGKVLNQNPNDDLEGLRDIGRGAGKLVSDKLQDLVMPKPNLKNVIEGVSKFAAKVEEDLEEKHKKEEEEKRLQELRERQGFEKKDSKSPTPEMLRSDAKKDDAKKDDAKKDQKSDKDFHEANPSTKHSPHGVGAVHHAKENYDQRLDTHEPSTVPHGSEVVQIRDLKTQSGSMSGLQKQVLYESTFGMVNPTYLREVERLLEKDKGTAQGPTRAEKGPFKTDREEDREKLRAFRV